MTKTDQTDKKAPKKFEPKQLKTPAQIIAGKLEWVRETVRAARLNAWKYGMGQGELDDLAQGLAQGFEGDGTEEVTGGAPGAMTVPMPTNGSGVIADENPAATAALRAQLEAELARLTGKAVY